MNYPAFRKIIWHHYRLKGRIFPWRKTRNPYRILVSEIMLQQTQTSRVLPKYALFLKAFPSFKKLARAETREVLKIWQGLGYNRRALLLKRLAGIIVNQYRGRLPHDPELFRKLPGVGPATTGAVSAFAFNIPCPFIETNIRRVFLHFFFRGRTAAVNDAEILSLVSQTMDIKNPRQWFWALMDYGAALGNLKENPNRKSRHYYRQSPFRGSFRELRGKTLTLLLQNGVMGMDELIRCLGSSKGRLTEALRSLQREGFIEVRNRRIAVMV